MKLEISFSKVLIGEIIFFRAKTIVNDQTIEASSIANYKEAEERLMDIIHDICQPIPSNKIIEV